MEAHECWASARRAIPRIGPSALSRSSPARCLSDVIYRVAVGPGTGRDTDRERCRRGSRRARPWRLRDDLHEPCANPQGLAVFDFWYSAFTTGASSRNSLSKNSRATASTSSGESVGEVNSP